MAFQLWLRQNFNAPADFDKWTNPCKYLQWGTHHLRLRRMVKPTAWEKRPCKPAWEWRWNCFQHPPHVCKQLFPLELYLDVSKLCFLLKSWQFSCFKTVTTFHSLHSYFLMFHFKMHSGCSCCSGCIISECIWLFLVPSQLQMLCSKKKTLVYKLSLPW